MVVNWVSRVRGGAGLNRARTPNHEYDDDDDYCKCYDDDYDNDHKNYFDNDDDDDYYCKWYDDDYDNDHNNDNDYGGDNDDFNQHWQLSGFQLHPLALKSETSK